MYAPGLLALELREARVEARRQSLRLELAHAAVDLQQGAVREVALPKGIKLQLVCDSLGRAERFCAWYSASMVVFV
jgi:hypothetical protein